MKYVFMLWHTHGEDDEEKEANLKLIGVYSGESEAEAARVRKLQYPGFRQPGRKSVTFLEPLKPPVRANSPVTTVPVLRFYSLKTLVFSACTEWHEYALRAGRQPLRPPIFAMPGT
jgi:hypothetical protein